MDECAQMYKHLYKIKMSGWQDSNLRPPGPKPGAITGLRYTPSGEGGIRTPGTGFPVRQFSKLLVSATHPPHHILKIVFLKRDAKVKKGFHLPKEKLIKIILKF